MNSTGFLLHGYGLAGQGFALFQWRAATNGAVGTLAYEPDVLDDGSDRWGDTMAVRGADTGTQILLGSRFGTNVVLFTTQDGTAFIPTVIAITNVPPGFAGRGVAFGVSNTFWAKSFGGDLYQIAFDLVAGTGGAVLDFSITGQIPSAVSGVGVDPVNNIYAGINLADRNNDVQLFQLTGTTDPPILFDQAFFPSYNPNGNGNTAIAMKFPRLYALAVNNGLVAVSYQIPLNLTEIHLAGNGQTITNGDVTPSLADGTDFGNASAGGGTVVRTFTIQNTGMAHLHLTGTPPVAVTGPQAADFTVTLPPTSPVAASGGTTTFQVTFAPGAGGTRAATVSLPNDAADQNPYVFAIQGTGVKAWATVTLGTLSQTYDGTARSVTVTTAPPGLAVEVTYNGSANAPTNAGSYAVVGTVNDPLYQGSTNGTLVVAQAPATLTLSNLVQAYNGTARSVSAATSPPGLTVNITYNGSANAPTNVGSYAVLATVDDLDYQGSATNTLIITACPLITTQPTNQTVVADNDAEFRVGVVGTTPLYYQWLYNGVILTNSPSFGHISGATTRALYIKEVQPGDTGDYTVVVTNGCGAVTSAVATLTVGYTLYVNVVGGGVVASAPDLPCYLPNSSVVLTAVPLSCEWVFSGWSGAAAGNANPMTLTLITNYALVTANFTGPQEFSFSTIAGLAGASGSANGTNGAARFNYPAGIAVDGSGNLYVADNHNFTIRKLAPVGTNWVVSTLAGLTGTSGSADGTNSAARFKYPLGIAVDGSGNLFVADGANFTIRKLTPVGTNWVVSTVAGLAGVPGSTDGTNSAARFNYPTGVAVDSAGNLYVTESQNCTIRKLTAAGADWVVSTVAGLAGWPGWTDGTNSAARFGGYNLESIALDMAGTAYVADGANETIRRLAPFGADWLVTTVAGLAGVAGSADGTNSTARFKHPFGVAVDSAGRIYVTDSNDHTVRQGVPLPGAAPVLRTTLAGNQFLLAWPLSASCFALERSSALGPGVSWMPVTDGITTAGDHFALSRSLEASAAFYRLRK